MVPESGKWGTLMLCGRGMPFPAEGRLLSVSEMALRTDVVNTLRFLNYVKTSRQGSSKDTGGT